MPAVIEPEDYDRWLDPEVQDAANVSDILRPYPAEKMQAWPVDAAVGNVRNQGAQLIEPVVPPGLF